MAISGVSELDLPPVSNIGPIQIHWKPEAPKKLKRAQSRDKYRLTEEEAAVFRGLPAIEGRAFKFWQRVAADRGLDYRTIIGSEHDFRNFTALPFRHGRPWCWPSEWQVKKPPPDFAFLADTGQPDQSAPARSQPTHRSNAPFP